MKLTDITIKGAEFEIGVTEKGQFFAPLGDDVIRAATLDELKAKIEGSMKTGRIVINVPFTRLLRGEAPRPAVATGIHATNGDILIKYLDGARGTDRLGTYRLKGETCSPLSDEEMARGRKLASAYRDAVKELSDFHSEHCGVHSMSSDDRFDLLTLVNDAMAKAAAEL